MQPETINPVEWAVGAATLVLAARLFALIQATRGVPDAHTQITEALATGDVNALEEKATGLGYRNPYGEGAADLISAAARETKDEDERRAIVEKTTRIVTRRIARATQQAQAMDLTALALVVGIITFSPGLLPTGPLFWSLAGAVIILLSSSFVARGQLRASVVGCLESLGNILLARPQLPSLSDETAPCLWCGANLHQGQFSIEADDGSMHEEVRASVCLECGKFVATLPPSDL